MAGMGFDASVMADAPEKLKAQFGWPAYVVAGMKHLNGKRFDVEVSIDGGPPQHRQARTVVVGNVGRLQGGVELLPDADPDDGELGVVLLSRRASSAGRRWVRTSPPASAAATRASSTTACTR